MDDEAGTLSIEGTVIRVPGSGLIVQDHTKSRAGMRTITRPSWVIDLLNRRHAVSHSPWVFPSTRHTLRDPDTARQQLRKVLRGTPWAGLHPNAFRHFVATRLDAAGLSAREIADYLGARAGLDDSGRLHVPPGHRTRGVDRARTTRPDQEA